jgi:hypothetical protein
MIRHQIKTLSLVSPTEITIDDSINGVNTLVIQNINDSGYVYVGGYNVSDTDFGFKIYPQQAFTVELRPFDKIYAVGDALDISVMVIERST